MKEKSSFAEVLVSILIFIAVLYIIGSIGNKKESDTASYSHSRYSSSYSTKSTTGSGSSYNSSTKKNTTGTSNTNKNTTGTSSSKKNNPYNSYDDGYDDIYMDDDYDYDRYYKDSDYADGVDDAMDDLDEDWQEKGQVTSMVDARRMKKILINNGYEYQRCKGSHFMYSNGVYTVAVNKDLNAMVAKRIIKQYHLKAADV